MSTVIRLPQKKPPNSLTASEVLDAVPGMSYKQLDFWTRTGRIKALPRTGRGSGYYNRYAPDQVALAKRMLHLIELGFTVHAAEKFANDKMEVHEIIFKLMRLRDGM